MNLIQKINAVNRVFSLADKHVFTFQSHSKLVCLPNCGLCCIKTNIETTILEYLPAAYNLYISGEYSSLLDSIENTPDSMCAFYNSFSNSGFCSQYKYRGLVCRLFGFSVKTEKTGAQTLVTCKPIKQNINLNEIKDKLQLAPEMSNFYMKLYGIDPKLTVQYFPVNQSIKKAMEIVLLYFQYKKKRA